MTRILFLHGASDRLAAAARWLTEAMAEKETVLVYAPATEQAERLDRLLWTQAATGFVPHCRHDSPLSTETPIVLTTQLDAHSHDKTLLTLADEVPPGFSRFEQLVELVSNEDHVRLPARERFKFYRERGYAIESRDIGQAH